MNFFETIKKRHSVRNFKETKIEAIKLNEIFKAIELAPSAGNLKAFDVFIVKDSNKKKELAIAVYGQNFVATAPVVLVFCANPEKSSKVYGKRGSDLYCVQDATIAACYTQLALTALGLGSCWVGAFDESTIRQIVGVPQDLVPVCVLPIGFKEEIKNEKEI